MAFLPAAFLLSLVLAAHGVYLQPPETSLGPNLFSSVSANSTCNGVSYTILTPLGATNTTDICNSFPAAAIDGALSSQWLSMPGDNVAEFTIGVSVSHSRLLKGTIAFTIHSFRMNDVLFFELFNISVCLVCMRQLEPSHSLHACRVTA